MQPATVIDEPLETLLRCVLTGVRRDLPGALGTAVSMAHPRIVAGAGCGYWRRPGSGS